MSAIFVCHTTFQWITAIRIKQTLRKDVDAYLVATDEAGIYASAAGRLKKTGLFRDVFYVPCSSYPRKILLTAEGITGHCIYPGKLPVTDELFFFNESSLSSFLFAYLLRHNPALSCRRYEEGIFSYPEALPASPPAVFIKKVRSAFRKPNLLDSTKDFYCFEPSLYKGPRNPVRIPKIDPANERETRLISGVFTGDRKIREYREKYIYFSTTSDQYKAGSDEELKLAKKIAERVGKDNLLIKAHPKDDVRRYQRAGLKTDENSGLPWEAIQLSGDFSDKVFLTAYSSSILSLNRMLQNPVQSYFLYPLCDSSDNPVARSCIAAIDRFFQYAGAADGRFRIIRDLDEITERGSRGGTARDGK
ncbi:MAG: hypothetical protein ACOYBC_03235 [Bilifractor sp.]|jgi:hypothetical protein